MAISTQQIIDFLASNPTNQQIAEAMVTFKVSPEQITAALTEQEAKLGGTTTIVENAETGQTSTQLNDLGGGFNATYKPPVIEQTEQGITYTSPPELSGFSRVDPANKDYIHDYNKMWEQNHLELIQTQTMCPCGGTYMFKNKATHFRTKLHHNYMLEKHNKKNEEVEAIIVDTA
jgi:hypothetical protein